MSRTPLIVVGPLPPPYHGVTVSTSLVLASPALRERFDVRHVDTSDHRTRGNIGRWDLINVLYALRALGQLGIASRGTPGVVYLPLSQSTPGFVRDSLLIRAASLRGWRVAIHLRGSEFGEYYRRCSPFLRRWIRATMSRVDSAAVMGDSLKNVLAGLVPANRLAVVPNGTPEHRSNGVTRDPCHVLFLSSLRRRKGIAEAVDAAMLVADQVPSARFSFVGSWESPELEREMRHRASTVGRAIAFHRPVEGTDKDRLLGSAAVFLFPPTQPEGHPRVILEALAAGLPVVTTHRGAIGETVIDGESGFVLDEPTPQLLAQHITLLLSDDELRERMSDAARRRYLEGFTQEHADASLADWLSALT